MLNDRKKTQGSPWLLGGLVLVGLAFLVGVGWKRLDLAILPQVSPFWKQTFENFQATTRDFGFQRTMIVVLQAPPGEDVFSLRMMKLDRALSKAIKETPSILQVISLSESLSLQSSKGTLTVKRLLPDDLSAYTPLAQKILRQEARLDPLLTGSLVSTSQKATLIIGIFTQPPPPTQTAQLLSSLETILRSEPSVAYGYEGLPPLAVWMQAQIRTEARWFLPLLAFFLLVGWFFSLRSIASIVWGLGLWLASASFGLAVFAIVWGSLPVLTGLSSLLLLFLLLPWIVDLSIPSTSSTIPRLLSTLFLWLLAILLLLGLFSIQNLFLPSLALAFLFSGLFLLALSPLLPSTSEEQTPFFASLVASLLPRWMGYRRSLLALSLVGLPLVFALSPPLRAGRTLAGYLPSFGPLKRGADLLEGHFGGATPLLLRFQGDLRDPVFLKAIERLGRHLEVTPGVSSPQSYAALIRHLHKLMNQIPRIPDTSDQVRSLGLLMEGQAALSILLRSPHDGILQARIAAPHLSRLLRSASRLGSPPSLSERSDLPSTLARLAASIPTAAEPWKPTLATSRPSLAQMRPPSALLQDRAAWITEGIELWVKRHLRHDLLLAQKRVLQKSLFRRLQSKTPLPAPKGLPETPLASALAVYLQSEACDLEISRAEQIALQKTFLRMNQTSAWSEEAIAASLSAALQGTSAAKDRQGQRYATRSLRLLAERLQRKDLLDTLLADVDQALGLASWWAQAPLREALASGSPSPPILELHGELLDFVSPSWWQTKQGPPRLSIALTGLQAILWPLADLTFHSLFLLSFGLLALAAFLGFLLLRSPLLALLLLLPSGLSLLLLLTLASLFSFSLDLAHLAAFFPFFLLSLSFSFRLALYHSPFLPRTSLSSFYNTVVSMLRLLLLLLLPLLPFFASSLPLLREISGLLWLFLPTSFALSLLFFPAPPWKV